MAQTVFERWFAPIAKKFRKWVTSEVLSTIRKTGSYSIYPNFPGEMIPTNCAVLTCQTEDGGSKQVYLLWGDDTWFGCGKMDGDREIVMKSMLNQIGDYDKEVVQYNKHAFLLKNGEWKSSCLHSKPVDKYPNNENAISGCKQAIERYMKAKDDVKISAEAMIKYINNSKI